MASRSWAWCVVVVGVAMMTGNDARAEMRVESSTGIGLAALATQPSDHGAAKSQVGVALDMRTGIRIGDYAAVNFLAGLGFTELDRTRDMAGWGLDAGRWSTHQLRALARWVGGPNDEYYLLKLLPAFFGYVGLAVTYVAAGAALVLSPLASMSYALAGPTGSLHFGGDVLNGFVEAGIGGMLTAPPGAQRVHKNYGPLLGVGAKLGPVALAARLLWSPPDAHTELGPERTDVFAGSLTASLVH